MQKKQIAFILILLLAVFQNCTIGTSSNSSQSSIDAKGNGDGYAGKVKYIDLDLNSACGGSSKAEIEVTDGTMGMITKENCRSITPRMVDIAALGLMPHDPAHLIFNENLFQVVSDTGQSIFLCRANTPSFSGGENYVLDAIVRNTPGGLAGQVHLGIYDLNMNLKRTISYDHSIQMVQGPGESKLYLGDVGPQQRFHLQLNETPANTLTGTALIVVPDPGSEPISLWVPNVSCNTP